MDIAAATAWGIAVTAATAVFIFTFREIKDFKRSLTYSLILLKVFATVYWLAGLDRPLLKVYYVVNGRAVWSGAITANIAIIIVLAITVILIHSDKRQKFGFLKGE